MKYSPLGRTGLQVSRVCLGTMTWGQQNSQAEGFEQMDYALTRGINFFDTAELYSIPPKAETQGSTETIIGNWFAQSGKRHDVILATKMAGRSDAMTWFRGGSRQNKAHIEAAVDASLARLQTDYIDLYQLHWPDRRIQAFGAHTYSDYDNDYESFHAILENLDSQVKAGKIRHIGVSNESAYGVMKFLHEAEVHGLPRLASIQNVYSLVSRHFDNGLAEIAMREDVGLLAYSPLAQGYLTGKYRGGALPAGARKTLFDRAQRYEGPGGVEMIDKYLDLAQRLGVAPEVLALKFVDTRMFVTSTIIGATTMAQLKTDIDAFDTVWTEDMEAGVRDLHLSHPSPCP